MTDTAAILDIDGTLVDSNYFHAVAWYRAMREHDYTLPMWRIHRAIGMGGDQLIGALLGDEVEQRLGDSIRDVENTKPEPDLVNSALEKVGGGPAVMVGDSVYDCEAAGNAGVDTIAVLTGGFSDSELIKAGAVIVFASIAELRERLAWTPLG